MVGRKTICHVSMVVLLLGFPCVALSAAQDTAVISESDRSAARETVRTLYRDHLEREADEAGLDAHVDQLLTGGRTEAQIARALQSSPEGQRVQARRQEAQRQARQQARRDRWEWWGNLFRPYTHVLYALGLAIMLGLVISQVYKHTHRGMNFELSFMSTLVLLAPIVAMVMLFIRGDLVLSLGLIGSLSIIRFRTPIKDTRDMIFLFWTIAVGLGAGTFNWMVVLLASVVMVPMVFVLYGLRYGRSKQADFILVCGGSGDCPASQVQALVAGMVHGAVVRSHEIGHETWETVYELRRADAGEGLVRDLLPGLKAIEGVTRVSLLAPKLDLPV